MAEGSVHHYGWTCSIDEWSEINYSQPVPMRNVVCTLPGESTREIVVVAHHDQSPLTVQGADNDGSGIATLLHLGEIFGSEKELPYTLVFVATDAEEYGMLGAKRFVDTHPDTGNIIAGFSLDNLGKEFYSGMDLDGRGQFHKIGQLWLQLLTVDAARAAGDLWPVKIRAPLGQVTDQAVPISFMDEGPLVSAGVPALGFAGLVPPEYAATHWETYHSPLDSMDHQSADTLYQSGRTNEAIIRQLLTMTSFPSESGPYLYLESSRQVLRGAPLWGIFIGFVALFFLGSVFAGGADLKAKIRQWRYVLPHFLGLWLPLIASVAPALPLRRRRFDGSICPLPGDHQRPRDAQPALAGSDPVLARTCGLLLARSLARPPPGGRRSCPTAGRNQELRPVRRWAGCSLRAGDQPLLAAVLPPAALLVLDRGPQRRWAFIGYPVPPVRRPGRLLFDIHDRLRPPAYGVRHLLVPDDDVLHRHGRLRDRPRHHRHHRRRVIDGGQPAVENWKQCWR